MLIKFCIKNILLFGVLIFTGCTAPAISSQTNKQMQQISLEEFHKKMKNQEKFSAPVIFEKTEHGFSINGKAYKDEDGDIEDVGFNKATGFVSYLIHIKDDEYAIKSLQVLSNEKAFTVAQVKQMNNIWYITSCMNETLHGKRLILGSKGFVLVQENEDVLLYDYLSEIKTIHIQAGYQISSYQNGDISDSKIILTQSSKILSGFNICDYFKSTADLNYHLTNLDTNRSFDMNISHDGSPSKICTKYMGRWNNPKCVQYKERRTPLSTSIEWIYSPSGVIAITLENSMQQIYMTNLTTNKKTLLDSCPSKFKGFKIDADNEKKFTIMATCKDTNKIVLKF